MQVYLLIKLKSKQVLRFSIDTQCACKKYLFLTRADLIMFDKSNKYERRNVYLVNSTK